jgi:DNA polymerase-4
MRDDPTLRGKPLAVGGRVEARGVVSTCNYEARAFGVRSAMSTVRALRLCPQLILLPPDFRRYRDASRQILAIYRNFTSMVEPLSLDEAYLDVSGIGRCQGSATKMAEEIRARIRTEVGITASAGIAPNKFLAKVASDWNKPDGQFVIRPQDADAFAAALPVGRIFGVGKVTAARMQKHGIQTCGDLRAWDMARLIGEFGRFGSTLYQLCRGIDERPVQPYRIRKSLSVETTYACDLPGLVDCHAELPSLIAEFRRRFAKLPNPRLICNAVVKVKFADFTQTTAECVCAASPDEAVWGALLDEAHARQGKAVRLLGVGVRFADVEEEGGEEGRGGQFDLFKSAP